jgi:hypothetical protein
MLKSSDLIMMVARCCAILNLPRRIDVHDSATSPFFSMVVLVRVLLAAFVAR